MKKILIPLLAIGVIGSLAATIGVAAAPGSRDEWAPLLALEPEAAAKLKKIQELAPQRWRSESRAPDDVCYTIPCLDLGKILFFPHNFDKFDTHFVFFSLFDSTGHFNLDQHISEPM